MTKVYVKTFLAWNFDKPNRQSKTREKAIEQLNLFFKEQFDLFLQDLSPQYEIINIIEEWNDNKTELELIVYYKFKRG